MRKEPNDTPRQRSLDNSAIRTGQYMGAGYDGQSYEELKEAKNLVDSKSPTRGVRTPLYEWKGTTAQGAESERYKKQMEAAYWATKDRARARNGEPTGYDAAMRGTASSSTSAAMQKSSAAMEKMRRLAQAAKKKP